MRHRTTATLLAGLLLVASSGGALASEHDPPPAFTPGAPGIGDPYFPLDGNGGYDVQKYDLNLRYDPATDVLTGIATLTATATQNLSSFNLDFEGLTVRSISVDGTDAAWGRDEGELTVTPGHGLRVGLDFTAIIAYDGIPVEIDGGNSGFIATDDGALVLGQPDVAATWFPVNDHPLDRAVVWTRIAVPDGLEAVANGFMGASHSRDGWTTWAWRTYRPMAPYLAVLAIGEFDIRDYEAGGLRYWDALDPDLFRVISVPRTGEQFAISQVADTGYKRLARTITVPTEGAELSFWVIRDTEPEWDYLTVEARPAGTEEWTTLPDAGGHASQDTGQSCPYWLGLHPFLTHYQTANEDGTCAPSGTTGQWWGASGSSDGYEQWTVDLAAYSGADVEVSISYLSDDAVQGSGLLVDDIAVSTGEGSTSFEDDGDVFDGWTVPGAPAGSAPNANDWIAGEAEDGPPTLGDTAEGSLARQPEILDFLSGIFGPYPFGSSGGIVDDFGLGFALETQTRPVYSPFFFGNSLSGDSVIVHELAHQWVGDSLAVSAWEHIWLNEGFATYAEWLWSEGEGFGSAQEIFDFWSSLPADDPLWALTIGDPGPDRIFDFAVYVRGAMTLHALRIEVGDEAFWGILRRWVAAQWGGNVSTAEFLAVAERESGRQLDELFTTWLFTPSKPPGLLDSAAGGATAPPAQLVHLTDRTPKVRR